MIASSIIVLLIIYLLWKLGTRNHDYFKKHGIRGPPPLPFIGNMLDINKNGFVGLDLKYSQKYGKIFGFILASYPSIVVCDKKLLHNILIKDAHYFTDRMSFGLEGYPMRKAVNVLKGAEWKRVRNLLTPTFTTSKIKSMTPLIQDCIDTLIKKMRRFAEARENVDMRKLFNELTMDVIASSMFGVRVNCQEDPDDVFYHKALRLISFSLFNPVFLLAVFFPWIHPVIKFFKPNGFMPKDIHEYFLSTIRLALESRRKNKEKRNDFLDSLIAARENYTEETRTTDSTEKKPETSKFGESANRGLSEDELLAQCMIFLFAGFFTTASLLHFCSYFLATNLTAQDQCRQEILQTLGRQIPTYDNVKELRYLDSFMNEVFRMCPPALRSDRTVSEACTLMDSEGLEHHFQKNELIVVPIHALQNDPETWDEPETFKPERFLEREFYDERVRNLDFLPFGAGPRNCIGMRFALMEARMTLVSVLQNFRLHVCDNTMKKLEFSNGGFMDTKEPIILQLESLAD